MLARLDTLLLLLVFSSFIGELGGTVSSKIFSNNFADDFHLPKSVQNSGIYMPRYKCETRTLMTGAKNKISSFIPFIADSIIHSTFGSHVGNCH